MPNNRVPDILKKEEFGKNTVNSLDTEEKKELQNLKRTLPGNFQYQENLIYTKNVNIWGEKVQLGTVINNLISKEGKTFYKSPKTGKEIPIGWRSELWALMQLYLIISNKYDSLDFKEIDGIVWRRTLWAITVKEADDQVAKMESQRINNETKETNERLNKAREAYKWLKNNVFGKDLSWYFPDWVEAEKYWGFVAREHLEWYVDRFRRWNNKGNIFRIDTDSRLDKKGKIHLEFDPSRLNWDFEKWVVDGSRFVDKDNKGKYTFNEKKFQETIKRCIAKSVVKWWNSM